MNRAKPTAMRKALVVVKELKDIGILFVPMPVLSDQDYTSLNNESIRRLEVLAKLAEGEELTKDFG